MLDRPPVAVRLTHVLVHVLGGAVGRDEHDLHALFAGVLYRQDCTTG